MNKLLLSLFIISIFTICNVYAYSTSDIQHFWSFNFNSDYVTFDDVQDVALSWSNLNMSLSWNNTISNPSLYFGSWYVADGAYLYNYSAYPFGSKSFSISMWANPYGGFTNYERYIILNWTGGTVKDYVRGSGSGIYFYIGGTAKISNTSVGLATYDWSHIVLSYDNSSNVFKLYLNGLLMGSYTTDYNSTDGFGIGQITSGWVDDIVLFNKSISADDVLYLYNAGTGQPPEEIITPTGQSSGLTLSYYDICVGLNYWCEELVVVNGSALPCNITDQHICLTGGCNDFSNYYYDLGLTPADMHYNASCGLPSNICAPVNLTECTSDDTYKRCSQTPAGNRVWLDYDCPINTVCSNGVCVAPTNPGGSIDNNELWGNFFGFDTSSDSSKIAIAIIVIIICGVCGAGIIFSVSQTNGGMPGFIATGIMGIFVLLPLIYFIVIGFIPFWVLVILIILCAFIVATTVRNKVVGV